jgi:FRG domain
LIWVTVPIAFYIYNKKMETIAKSEMWSFFDPLPNARTATNTNVRNGPGHPVESFLELATKVAELQFRNRDYVLLFRGQRTDHQNQKGNTTLKPSLLRAAMGPKFNPGPDRLTQRFENLQEAEQKLIEEYTAADLMGLDRLKRHRVLRWAILQHYEVCRTPLLDVTHSLRIAASFASIGMPSKAFLMVLGVPNLSGAVTASAESGLQIIRLSSVCPPSAVRPHIQEGYLLGEYPEMADFRQKANYFHYEIDFGRRLVAKFSFTPRSFWRDGNFPQVHGDALYPSVNDDPMYQLTERVKAAIDTEEN